MEINNIRKRNGSQVKFDQTKIFDAIKKAFVTNNVKITKKKLQILSDLVVENIQSLPNNTILNVDIVQNEVEKVLISNEYRDVAKLYMDYRDTHDRLRKKSSIIEKSKKIYDESKKYFDIDDPIQEFLYFRTYSKWKSSEKRRESWVESVDRYMDFMKERLKNLLTNDEYEQCRNAILNREVMPSMRLLWSAGDSCRTNNATAYNCAYTTIKSPQDFAEFVFLGMSSCGIGDSVEKINIGNLPIIQEIDGDLNQQAYIIEDSKQGWADSIKYLINNLYNGINPTFDYSKIRPAGSRLKTSGGRASGPEPLKEVIEYIKLMFKRRINKRLSPIDVQDIINKIGQCVEMGGSRRMAIISFSDLDDVQMRDAKVGAFWLTNPQRSYSNNSAVYTTKPTEIDFIHEFLSLIKSGTGERGIFNQGSLPKQLPKRRIDYLKKRFGKFWYKLVRCNPCGEIYLIIKEFCNLTSVVVKASDTEEDILRKIFYAVLIGTYQSMLTEFPYLDPEWKKNCEEERLLGVSLAGTCDNYDLFTPEFLEKLREYCVQTNIEFANRFNINPSNAITAIKPDGNTSVFNNSAPGVGPRLFKYNIRNVRISAHDPLFRFMKDRGVPFHPEVNQEIGSANTYVLQFPCKSPETTKLSNEFSAIDLLENWKKFKVHYTEHNPSQTIYVENGEWIEVMNWVYKNWDYVGGLTFLPKNDHVYQLAPIEEITKEQYEKLISEFPKLDYSELAFYEEDDETDGIPIGCEGDKCLI